MKKITLLGSTGSIGTQTLKVVDRNSDKFTVFKLCLKLLSSLFMFNLI